MAIESGRPSILLYILDHSIVADGHYDERHWRFVKQSLLQMQNELTISGNYINVLSGDTILLFDYIVNKYKVSHIYSHEETGVEVTYAIDRSMKSFAEKQKIAWSEFQSNGIVRGIKNRKNWIKNWYGHMYSPIPKIELPSLKSIKFDIQATPLSYFDSIEHSKVFQPGGREYALKYLYSFCNERGQTYTKNISKPLAARKSCSRLSPYFAWGNLSIREVYQYQLAHLKAKGWAFQSRVFGERLRWHCHFIQKFEMESTMEFENYNSGFNTLEKPVNENYIDAWKNGKTGYPLVDACMRCVCETGYLNFRMRAMVISFFTQHLWQDWRYAAIFLGKQFLDFEPGIHYPQIQMQAGTTGTNTVRIYNPIKQSKDHDPEGVFIKLWIPELANCPIEYIHEPWTMPLMIQQMSQFAIGEDYPSPIVNLVKAGKAARDKTWGHRKDKEVIGENKRIVRKHIN
jgi:deoxyribodipyrimidine photo-lyase